MFKTMIDVSSRDTDALGHVYNTSVPLWFEVARNPLYKIFNPDMVLDPSVWNLIMVHAEYDYHDQIFFGEEVEIKTYKPIDKCKEFSGVLKAYDKDTITIESDNNEMIFQRADIAIVRLALDF